MGKRTNEEKERALRDAGRLCEAVRFATEKHVGQFRKETTIPYIVHPLEVMSILVGMDADVDLLIDALDDLQRYEKAEKFYWEMNDALKDMFVEGLA